MSVNASSDLAPSGKPWSFGIRTWNVGGLAHGDFKWDLTPGARTVAPDCRADNNCGGGLHANKDGWGDWTLLNLNEAGKVVGIVRWDSAEEMSIDGGDKFKAPWMEVVLTTESANVASVYSFINAKWRERLASILKEEGTEGGTATGYKGHASATGDSGHASATGDSGHASATGYKGHASATGDSGHASATGNYGHASATGDNGHASATGDSGHASATGNYGHASATGNYGHASATGDSGHASATGDSGIAASLGGGRAKAAKGGAIMLSAWDYDETGAYVLKAVFAGMVGRTYNKVKIKPDVEYVLTSEGKIREAD